MKTILLAHLAKQFTVRPSSPSCFALLSAKAKAVLAEQPKKPQVQMAQNDYGINYDLMVK